MLLMLLTSCSQPPPKAPPQATNNPNPQPSGQWVLESYDATKGYTFRRDGVSYLTNCFSIKRKVSKTDNPTMLREFGYVLDGPSNVHMDVKDQSQCNELLEYIHKPVPLNNETLWGRDVFLVARPEETTIYLRVMSAK